MDFKLAVVRVFVSDWERALDFYTNTLGIPTTYRNDTLGWAQLATGTAELALERVAERDEEGKAFVGRFLGVSLQVEDIQSTYERLVERDVEFLMPPKTQAWGGVLAHLRDPDGNVLTLLGSPG